MKREEQLERLIAEQAIDEQRDRLLSRHRSSTAKTTRLKDEQGRSPEKIVRESRTLDRQRLRPR